MKVVLAGGAGVLGRRIAADLAGRGHEIVILTRRERPELPHRQVLWDGATVEDWAGEPYFLTRVRTTDGRSSREKSRPPP